MVAGFVGGVYGGGAASLGPPGRRVGVVVAKGFKVLRFAAGAVEGMFRKELFFGDDDFDDISFLETKAFKLKGMMLNLEDMLVCEQKVGVVVSVILFVQ